MPACRARFSMAVVNGTSWNWINGMLATDGVPAGELVSDDPDAAPMSGALVVAATAGLIAPEALVATTSAAATMGALVAAATGALVAPASAATTGAAVASALVWAKATGC